MSSETKDEIINQSILLFNKFGISEISMRDIADACGISVGNLTYHFPKKKDLILAIVEKHQNERKSYPSAVDMDFNKFMDYLKSAERIRYTYSFYYDNFVDISRMFKEVSIIQTRVHGQVIEYFYNALCSFVKLGLFVPETKPNQYKDMATGLVMVTSFWGHHVNLTDKGPMEYSYLNQVIWSMLIPCMTERGRESYQRDIEPRLAG